MRIRRGGWESRGTAHTPLIGVSPHHPNTTTSFSQPSTAFPQTLQAFSQTHHVIPTNPSRHSHKPSQAFSQPFPSFPRKRESSGLRPMGIQRNTCSAIHQTEPSWCSRSHEQRRFPPSRE